MEIVGAGDDGAQSMNRIFENSTTLRQWIRHIPQGSEVPVGSNSSDMITTGRIDVS